MTQPRVAVVGASGYAGAELIRLLAGHGQFELSTIAAASNAGQPLTAIHPQFAGTQYGHMIFVPTIASVIAGHDVVFCALPHGESAALVRSLPDSVRVIDLGADFRLASASQWQHYYGGQHAGQWTYGLPE